MMSISRWWNYKTEQYDSRDIPPQTDEEAKMYISQLNEAQRIYELHRELGLSILNAMLETLKAQLPQHSHDNA